MPDFQNQHDTKSWQFYWTSDSERLNAIKQNSDVRESEARVDYWMTTDEGWEQFSRIYQDSPVVVTRVQIQTSTATMMERLSDYIGTDGRLDAVQEGMLRAAAIGYAIGMALPYSRGYRPRSKELITQVQADDTAKIMEENSPPTDSEWYGYLNRSGITVYQLMLQPLGESSDGAMERAETAFLMITGRWFIRYGIALANAQIRIEELQ